MPDDAFLVFQLQLVFTEVPETLLEHNCTLSTNIFTLVSPTALVAVTAIVCLLLVTFAPFTGLVIVTTGTGIGTGEAPLLTVTVLVAVPIFPAASFALTVSTTEPSATVVEFHVKL